ncbi:hypothetical protein NA57DRAFT_78685 [Rhizodiscina lignyota]|uniref:AAA+ ATPase lid domain-containing protein n=1 Tax=Rhizodiscina lignyota TaxID=1504668 RepID=A0A9P4IAX4_9PEZI|nr:hypothetical protein NA57DRAFT_78685 [Rhizodiscina lignyota]
MEIDDDARDFVLRDPIVKDLDWNGRDIRNCFQTAVTLAEYDANQKHAAKINLKRDHFEQVVEMSNAFSKYLKEARGGRDEAVWAQEHYLRADDYDEEAQSTPRTRGTYSRRRG